MTTVNKPKVVILGAGYGGLLTAVRLQKLVGVNDAEITLINKNDYHYETTWLHEASAGTLHHDRVRYNIADVINRSKVNFVQDSVEEIKADEKKVILSNGEVTYDYLVVALGGESETFGIKGLKENAFTITSVDSSRQIREHIEYQFATYSAEADKQEERLSIVVGGAGFTGIEFLGELVNRIPQLCKEYEIEQSKVNIYCVEAAPMALPGFDPGLVSYATALLEKKGVEFNIGTAIKECTPEGVLVAKGDEEPRLIKAGTVVWAAGVRGNEVIEKSGFENIRGRVTVDSHLRMPAHEDIFILGDCSAVINEENNRPFPPTAQIAMQQAVLTAKNIASLIQGKNDLKEFTFDNKGTVCSLGEHDAIGVVFGKKLTGFSASFMKKVIDNRALFMIGGIPLVLKKGKFNIF
ncbi:NAD(P)/FAD-dependent oxidoreductase [Caldibacillus lycopersici]|uniref:NAD(P)/FAD-dependent oxidoreductase n=1 Tax=Perspicuibacillus lycopersici TaxID=1325689 RepID=A0AAE3ISU4_9BACI|nr:NAD(P)/FAD-dependent oxidoreductase [Perspicuibacillus lycopersici]MCU9612814.1 NAD(P)/FAD-dependent oxidoreductase [Perspicuibacillus lycopersici]